MRDSAAYYATVAQVLPVLALVLLFELRAFGDWEGWWRRGGSPEEAREISPVGAVAALVYGALFLFGELGALSSVEDGKPSGFNHAVVPFAVIVYMAMIVIVPLQMHFEALMERIPPVRRFRIWNQARYDKRRAAKQRNATEPPESQERPDDPR